MVRVCWHVCLRSVGRFAALFGTQRHGVPQESVLDPLLFILYTTPHSSLISDSSLSHHLFADDTQLFISFRAPDSHLVGAQLCRLFPVDARTVTLKPFMRK